MHDIYELPNQAQAYYRKALHALSAQDYSTAIPLLIKS